MPWLTATAYLHSAMVEEKRRLPRPRHIGLAIAPFAITSLGPYPSRSGPLTTIHSCPPSAFCPLPPAWYKSRGGSTVAYIRTINVDAAGRTRFQLYDQTQRSRGHLG